MFHVAKTSVRNVDFDGILSNQMTLPAKFGALGVLSSSLLAQLAILASVLVIVAS